MHPPRIATSDEDMHKSMSRVCLHAQELDIWWRGWENMVALYYESRALVVNCYKWWGHAQSGVGKMRECQRCCSHVQWEEYDKEIGRSVRRVPWMCIKGLDVPTSLCRYVHSRSVSPPRCVIFCRLQHMSNERVSFKDFLFGGSNSQMYVRVS